MTRRELACFWDDQLPRWFRGDSLAATLERWKRGYAGVLQEWAFPEPFIGNLLGTPRIVLLANNPGIAHEELQSREGIFAEQIAQHGFTAWASTRPYEGTESEWEKRHGPIRHNYGRRAFARRFLNDESVDFPDLLNVELYPWHSVRLTAALRVDPVTLREFILEPLSELPDGVPVVALGRSWADALDRCPEVVTSRNEFHDFKIQSRQAHLYETSTGARILVVWHSGSDQPPTDADTQHLASIWLNDASGASRFGSAVSATTPSLKKQSLAVAGRTFADRPSTKALTDLFASLPQWVLDEFKGAAVAEHRGKGRFRLRVGVEGAARIGWDLRRDFAHVWARQLFEEEERTLREALSQPGSLSHNANDVTFRAHNEGDVKQLQALIRRCVTVT
jgi:hypothetical protein